MKQEYTPNNAPFEGKASYQMDYPTHRGVPLTRSIKPVEREYTKGGPAPSCMVDQRCSSVKHDDLDVASSSSKVEDLECSTPGLEIQGALTPDW